MEYKSNKNAVLAALTICKKEFCEGVKTLAVAEVKPLVPVGVGTISPGNLKKSVEGEVMPDNEGVYIGVTAAAPYGIYVEKGSSKQKAQPYLEPGTMNAIPKITKVAEQVYKNKMGKE